MFIKYVTYNGIKVELEVLCNDSAVLFPTFQLASTVFSFIGRSPIV